MLAWLREPTGDSSPEVTKVLTSYAPIWDVLFPESVHRAVAQLVWEIQWDGPSNEFTVLLDEIAIAEAYALIVQQDDERVSRRKPRRKKRKRGRTGSRSK